MDGLDQLGHAVEQVQQALVAKGVAWGLLLYRGTRIEPLKASVKNSRVLVLSVEDFLRTLSEEGFADIVRRLRNDRVHGSA